MRVRTLLLAAVAVAGLASFSTTGEAEWYGRHGRPGPPPPGWHGGPQRHWNGPGYGRGYGQHGPYGRPGPYPRYGYGYGYRQGPPPPPFYLGRPPIINRPPPVFAPPPGVYFGF